MSATVAGRRVPRSARGLLLRVASVRVTPGRLAAGCGALAFCLYAATVAHGAGWDDGGELAAGVARLGTVHVPGYPFYVLAGWVFSAIEPFGSSAVRADLWSAFAAAGAVAMIAYLVAWRTRSSLAAVVSAILLGTEGLFWSEAIQASVYPLLVLSILLLLIAGYRWYERPTPARLAWLAIATGMVAVSHRAGLVFVPWVAVLIVARAGRTLSRPLNLTASAGLFLPWLPAIYLPLRAAAHVFDLGEVDSRSWDGNCRPRLLRLWIAMYQSVSVAWAAPAILVVRRM